jgi:hypothetical protein
MTVPERPAAYLCDAPPTGAGLQVIAEAARQRGWPAPVIYAGDDSRSAEGSGLALPGLSAAISAGCHDGLLLPGVAMISRTPAQLVTILQCCTRHGVAVEFFSLSAAVAQAPLQPPVAAAPLPGPASSAEILASAGAEALTRLFPHWRIWSDQHGWHARRRGQVYLQDHHPGAPSFCVHARVPLDLAAQLRWQQAADTHAPSGCARR